MEGFTNLGYIAFKISAAESYFKVVITDVNTDVLHKDLRCNSLSWAIYSADVCPDFSCFQHVFNRIDVIWTLSH